MLKKIVLSGNTIKDEGAISLGESLKTNKSLEELELCNCDISAIGGKAIGEALQLGIAVLKKIILSSNSIKDEGAIALGESLKTNKSLEELELYKCDISAIGGKAIGEALQLGIAVPTDCNLLHNNLDVESATMLAKIGTEKGIMLSGIKRDQTEADFSGMDLQLADGILIASDLRVSAVLKTIVLSGNSIRDEGAIALGESLKTNKSLEGLELRSCDIGPEGAKGLADALASGSAVLTNLNLFDNSIGPEGAKALAAALSSGSAVLTKLDVRHNSSLGNEGKNALRAATKDRQNFVLEM